MDHKHTDTVIMDGDDQWANVNSQTGGYASDQEGAAHNVSEADATDGGSIHGSAQISEIDHMAQEDIRGVADFTLKIRNNETNVYYLKDYFLSDTIDKVAEELNQKFGFLVKDLRFVF